MSGGTWPWVLMALLGAYHGLNPAMGWLFAVSLGMQERSRRAVLGALPPIAIGHELSIALVALLVIGLELIADTTALHVSAGVALIAFGIFRFLRPRAHFRWAKTRVGRRELGLWSFFMSTAHGAGLMVAPVLLATTGAHHRSPDHTLTDMNLGAMSIPESALAIALHVGAMLLVMAVVSVLVYEKLGVAVLRRAWLNSDHLWAGAFVMAGIITFVT